uniref:Uncharacterized protein n=1 Tax=Oryza sativa subsp. japonica TaxID=39947 RepID=Q69K82_ORYSJ|nr:hypothetical protein [Oryza sativa Japonica Group]
MEGDLATLVASRAIVEGQAFVSGDALVPHPGEGRKLIAVFDRMCRTSGFAPYAELFNAIFTATILR